jgi:hypothetical protein
VEEWEIEIQKRDERNELIEQLKVYVNLEGTEIGEACNALCIIAGRMEYLSEEFQTAVDKELVEQLKMFQEQTTIIERQETRTYTVRELDWD